MNNNTLNFYRVKFTVLDVGTIECHVDRQVVAYNEQDAINYVIDYFKEHFTILEDTIECYKMHEIKPGLHYAYS